MTRVITPRRTFPSVAALARHLGTSRYALYRYLVWERGAWRLRPATDDDLARARRRLRRGAPPPTETPL